MYLLVLMVLSTMVTPDNASDESIVTQVSLVEQLSAKKELGNFLSSMTEYTKSTGIYVFVDNSTNLTMPLLKAIHLSTLWIKQVHVTSNGVKRHFENIERSNSILSIFLTERYVTISVLNELMDDVRILNKVSWLTFWPHYRVFPENFKISPSARIFVAHLEGIKNLKRPTVVSIQSLRYDYLAGFVREKFVGYWIKGKRFQPPQGFLTCCYNLTGYTINVVYIKSDEPYTKFEKVHNEWKITGIVGEVFADVVRHLGLKYGHVYPEPNDDYGTYDEKTNGTGMFRELVYKRADIAVSSLDMLEARRKAADFSFSFNKRSISALYKVQPEPFLKPTLDMYLSPFTLNSWKLIIATSSAYFVLILTFKHFLPGKKEERINYIALVAAILNQGQDNRIASSGWRLCHFSMILLGVLLTQFYGSKIISNSTIMKQDAPLKSFADLATHTLYKPLARREGAIFHTIKNSSNSEYRALWKRMKLDVHDHTAVTSEDELRQVMDHQAALINDVPILHYLRSKNRESLRIMEGEYSPEFSAMALQKYSPLTRIINHVLINMEESGIIKKVKNKYLKEKEEVASGHPTQIILTQIILPIVALAAGLGITLMFFSIECYSIEFMAQLRRSSAK